MDGLSVILNGPTNYWRKLEGSVILSCSTENDTTHVVFYSRNSVVYILNVIWQFIACFPLRCSHRRLIRWTVGNWMDRRLSSATEVWSCRQYPGGKGKYEIRLQNTRVYLVSPVTATPQVVMPIWDMNMQLSLTRNALHHEISTCSSKKRIIFHALRSALQVMQYFILCLSRLKSCRL